MTQSQTRTGTRRFKPPAPRVGIIEDDADVRRSIARLLDTVGLETQSFERARDALGGLRGDRPGCLVVDMRLPDRDGLDLIADLRERDIHSPAVIITAYADVPSAVRAMKLGVFEFLEKPFRDQQFIAAVQKAVDQDIERFMRDAERRARARMVERLSQREREVLAGIVDGSSSKAIAADLGISPKTVENYRASLMDKLEAENVAHPVTLVYDYFRPGTP